MILRYLPPTTSPDPPSSSTCNRLRTTATRRPDRQSMTIINTSPSPTTNEPDVRNQSMTPIHTIAYDHHRRSFTQSHLDEPSTGLCRQGREHCRKVLGPGYARPHRERQGVAGRRDIGKMLIGAGAVCWTNGNCRTRRN